MFPMVFRETPADNPPLRNRTLPLTQRMFHFDTLGGNKIIKYKLRFQKKVVLFIA